MLLKKLRTYFLLVTFWYACLFGCFFWLRGFEKFNLRELFMLPYSLLWLNEVVEPCWTSPSSPSFAWFLGLSIFLLFGSLGAINSEGTEESWFCNHLTQILRHFWGGSPGSTKFGRSAARMRNIRGKTKMRQLLKNKHFSSFLCSDCDDERRKVGSREKNAFLLWECSSLEGGKHVSGEIKIPWHTIFAVVFWVALIRPFVYLQTNLWGKKIEFY